MNNLKIVKHYLLFSGKNSINNINERGIFPRLFQNILQKNTIKINISLKFIYNEKVYDTSKFLFQKKCLNL